MGTTVITMRSGRGDTQHLLCLSIHFRRRTKRSGDTFAIGRGKTGALHLIADNKLILLKIRN